MTKRQNSEYRDALQLATQGISKAKHEARGTTIEPVLGKVETFLFDLLLKASSPQRAPGKSEEHS